jgi:hypothetical protein
MLTQLTQQIAAKPHTLDSRQQQEVQPSSTVTDLTRPLSPNDDYPYLLDAFSGLPAESQIVKDSNSEPKYETMELQLGGERIFGWPAAITLITSLSRKLAVYVSPVNGGHDTEEGGSIAPPNEQSSTVQAALRLHLEKFPFTRLCHESSFVFGDSEPIVSPPRLLVDYLVESFLRNVNNVIPIFDKFTLRSAIDKHYSGERPGENDPWALILNNIAALGLSLEVQVARISQASSRSMNEDIMPLFLRNCDRALANLEPFMRPSQDNVQALITLVCIAPPCHVGSPYPGITL